MFVIKVLIGFITGLFIGMFVGVSSVLFGRALGVSGMQIACVMGIIVMLLVNLIINHNVRDYKYALVEDVKNNKRRKVA